MKYHTHFCQNLGEKSQNLSSAAVVIGALRVNTESENLTSFFSIQNRLFPIRHFQGMRKKLLIKHVFAAV